MDRSQWIIYALGVLFLAVAVGQSAIKVAVGGSPFEATIDFVLVALPGLLLLSVGRWLSQSDIEHDLYVRIGAWCLGGVAVMLVFLLLRAVHPGVTTTFTFGTRAIALAIGSVAGLAIGIHDARAITRAREAEHHTDELQRVRRTLERRNDDLKRANAELAATNDELAATNDELEATNDELAATNDELEATNEELEATRDELERTVQELAASNERLDQFASIASHDLREPLRMVTSYLHLLERQHGDDLDDDAREFVDLAIDGAERMQSMVTGLLQYSRVETGDASFEPVDLETVAADVRADLRERVEETDAEITIGSLPRVRGEPSQLRQLFQNLLSNAIDYSDGPPRVEVTATAPDEESWVVSVRDEGVGIAAEDQEEIFEIFERRHAQEGGSGIGLALCRRVVEHHGGEIWVDSTPGVGSTFSFRLPRSAATSEDDDPESDSERRRADVPGTRA